MFVLVLTCPDLNYITWSEVHLGGRLDLGGHWGRQDVVEGVAGRGGGGWAVGRETLYFTWGVPHKVHCLRLPCLHCL